MFNKENKPYAVIAGAYKSQPRYEAYPDDGKIHLVYAGTFNPIKGGVFKAIDMAAELDENYHLHILGNAEEALFKAVVKHMIQTGAKTGCEITYDGCLQGEEYSKFLQKCHIGLSTQNENLPFSKTSFPSKILVYLANGLKVVSAPIEPVQATLSGGVYYYGDLSFKEAASRAMAEDIDTREIVKDLDRAARESVCRLLKK
jgi:glycosyltransferase involved in cell wall biosynthesis